MRKLRKEIKYILGTTVILIFSGCFSSYILNSKRINADFSKISLKNIFFTVDEFPQIDPYLTMQLQDDGYDIYVPSSNGYRYGPSIIYYDDGTMDAWFASNGNNKEWDWITYRHFDGNDWLDEEIVLKPTKKSLDKYSTCDPGVIYFGGYYYIGYTSTINATNGGVENNVFVARSEKPNGKYEKWNGEGWGGNPKPMIEYTDNDLNWGAGEPSFVIVGDKLYCYYSLINSEGSFTKLAIADLSENWPETLVDSGIAIIRKNNQDSFDVLYNDDTQSFLAFSIENRLNDKSSIALYESSDGMRFDQIDTIKGIQKNAHNMGISKKPNGHISLNDDLLIGYAYSKDRKPVWGRWSTRFHSIKLKYMSK